MKENAESRIAASHLKADADFRLWQFHMHWSDDTHKGSEHCIEGHHFAGEVRRHRTSSFSKLDFRSIVCFGIKIWELRQMPCIIVMDIRF